jgi:hypothetical protein
MAGQTLENFKKPRLLENGDSMPFLDVRVTRRVNKYERTVYHKKTFNGVYLNWTSLTSRKYKVGLINCYWIVFGRFVAQKTRQSSWNRATETDSGTKRIPTNSRWVGIQPIHVEKTSENVGEPSAEQVKPEKWFIVLPFVHRNAENFGIRLEKLVKVNYPQVDLNVAFKAFRFLDWCNKNKSSGGVDPSLVVCFTGFNS